MKKSKIFSTILLFIVTTFFSSLTSFAKDCKYTVKGNNVEVSWTAFKTPSKVGVGGQFRELGLPEIIEASSLEELFNKTAFNIDSASVYTRNSGRDAKIVKYFFQPMMGGLNITGGFQYESQENISLKLKMNSVEQKIPMKITQTDNNIKGEGIIDVFDFSLKKSLMGINKACFDLHQGKTWNDVEIAFSFKFNKKCK
jgi:hypothetical protein